MVAPLSGARLKWRHLPDKTGYHHHHHMVAPLSGIQVAPSSGQNWLSSSSSHGGATERCQVCRDTITRYTQWRQAVPETQRAIQTLQVAPSPDKTGYHHHHMVAPLSGARYSSGAIFRTKLDIIIITWWRQRLREDAERDIRAERRREAQRGTERSGAIFRSQNWSSSSSNMVAPLSGARYSSGAIFRTKLVIIISHGGATERCQDFKWRHLPDKTGHHHHHHMVAPLSGAGIQVAPSSGRKNVIIITGNTHQRGSGAILSPAVPGIQVAPSSGQNWLSSSSHGGALIGARFQVAPSSGQNWLSSSSLTHMVFRHCRGAIFLPSGAIFRTKLVIIIIITWWRH